MNTHTHTNYGKIKHRAKKQIVCRDNQMNYMMEHAKTTQLHVARRNGINKKTIKKCHRKITREKKTKMREKKIIFRFLFQCKYFLSLVVAVMNWDYTIPTWLAIFIFICTLHTYLCVRFSSSFCTIIPSQFAASRLFSSVFFFFSFLSLSWVSSCDMCFHIFLSYGNAFPKAFLMYHWV